MNTEQSNDKLELRWCSGVMLQFVHHSCNTDQSKKKNVEITQNRKHMRSPIHSCESFSVVLWSQKSTAHCRLTQTGPDGSKRALCSATSIISSVRVKTQQHFRKQDNYSEMLCLRMLMWVLKCCCFWATVGTSPSAMWRSLKQNMIYNWGQ